MAIAHPRQSHDTDGPKANHAQTFLDHLSEAAHVLKSIKTFIFNAKQHKIIL